MIPQVTDWDDAYANAPHIPGGAGFPDRWAAEAGAFRDRHPPATLGLLPGVLRARLLAENRAREAELTIADLEGGFAALA